MEENIHVDLGIAAGRYIGKFIKDGDIIGFSRGRATAAMVDTALKGGYINVLVTDLETAKILKQKS